MTIARPETVHVSKLHRFLYDKPCSMMGIVGFVTVLFLAIGMALPLTPTLSSNAWYDLSALSTRQQLAVAEKMTEWNDAVTGGNDEVDVTRSKPLDSLMVVIEPQGGGSALGAKALRATAKIESKIAAFSGIEEWCMLPTAPNSTATCEPWMSAAEPAAAYALVDATGAPYPDADARARIDEFWCDEDGERTAVAVFHADRKFTCADAQAKYARSTYTFGGPLKGHKNLKDGPPGYVKGGQHQKLCDDFFLGKDFALFLEELRKETEAAGDVHMYFGAQNIDGGVLYGVILYYLNEQYTWMAFSALAVFLYLAYKLRSWFLALTGFAEIFLSLPVSFAVYSLFGFEYLGFLQYMCFFVIMGIGADDIFVFVDAWRQAKAMPFADEHERFAFAYTRAVTAMTVTSATSAMAFFATALSPIPGVMCFGITMGIIVLVDFAFVITWFPACVLVYERLFETKCCVCSCPCPNLQRYVCSCFGKPAEPEAAEGLGYVEAFFHTTYSDWMADAKKRRGVLAAFALVYVVGIAVTFAGIEVTGDFPANFLEDHPMSKFEQIAFTEFSSGGDSFKIPLTINFGIDPTDPVDRSGISDPQSDDNGEPISDKAFDMSTHAAQLSVLELCRSLATHDDLVFNGETYCFMEDFVEWLNATGRDFYDESHAHELVEDDAEGSGFPSYLLGKTMAKWNAGQLYDTGLLIKGGSLDFAWIGFNTTLPLKYDDYSVKKYLGIIQDWKKLLDAHNAANPATRGVQFCLYWYFMDAAVAIIDSSITGVSVSMLFAFVVLIIANRNLLIPVLAIGCIIGILFMVALMIVLQGKTVGFMEGICLIIAIGLSVDYIVHLCHAYTESTKSAREDRGRDAVTSMGVSVVSGAITTFSAAVFLLMCQMTFFYEFGNFMVQTVCFSIFFALTLFIALVMEFGPVRDGNGDSTGDIRPLLVKAGLVKAEVRVLPEKGPELPATVPLSAGDSGTAPAEPVESADAE